MTRPADLTLVELAALLAQRALSSVELTRDCLARIRERDGTESRDGDPASINAWVRVYEDGALAAAARADERLARASQPALCGVPVGLKDLYAVAERPLTASSTLLRDVPERSCDAWARLEARGMVLLGHLHTHEFAAGGTTDQVGNPYDLARSAGGSSGGSGAALAARMVPAATGSDTAGSLRIPAALCGVSTIKPTRDLVPIGDIVPLAVSLDHAGPMARTVADCALLLEALAASPRPAPSRRPLEGARLVLSPRAERTSLDGDVSAGLDRALECCRRLGASLGTIPEELLPDAFAQHGDVMVAEMLAWHHRFDGRREGYRPSTRELLERAEARALRADEYVALQMQRRETAARLDAWLAQERVAGIVEPTVPVVAPLRGAGYEHAAGDLDLISLTHRWNWTGHPVVALPAGLGERSGLPVSVSLIGRTGGDWALLELATALQEELGLPDPPALQ